MCIIKSSIIHNVYIMFELTDKGGDCGEVKEDDQGI